MSAAERAKISSCFFFMVLVVSLWMLNSEFVVYYIVCDGQIRTDDYYDWPPYDI